MTSGRVGPVSLRAGGNVRAVRKRRRLSLEAMAQGMTDAGNPITLSGLGKLETAQRAITVDQLSAIAEFLGVAPSVLLEEAPVVPIGPTATSSLEDRVRRLEDLLGASECAL